MEDMTMGTRHKLEKAAIEMEELQAHHRNWTIFPYPWTNTKAAGAFGRAAKILRQALA